jgi:hypothetical protein
MDKDKIDFEFNDKNFILNDKKKIFEFMYGSEHLLDQNSAKYLTKRFDTTGKEPDVSFKLDKKELISFINIITTMNLDCVGFECKDKNIIVSAKDDANTKKFAEKIASNTMKKKDYMDKIYFYIKSFSNINTTFSYKIDIYKEVAMYLSALVQVNNEGVITEEELPLNYVIIKKK